LALVAAFALVGCGGERQDEDEPEGEFTLSVVKASFPERQSTAQRARLLISVRNTDDRELPNLAVTIKTTAPGGEEVASAFAQAADDSPTPTARSGSSTRAPRGARARTRTPGRQAASSPARRSTSSGG
jgi:hypothetical protein